MDKSIDHTFIIAEVGVNHNGDMSKAIKLIDAAIDAGADAIKFQAAIPELVATAFAKKAEYQKKLTNKNETQLDMIKQIHLPLESYQKLQNIASKKGIKFFVTSFDMASLKYIESLNPPMHKVPSGEITNMPYLRTIASYKRSTILSTGMSTIDEIASALEIFDESGFNRDELVILHCNTEYPSPMIDINLRAMKTIGTKFGTKIGYSDHTDGIEVSIAAVALGASVIEKHITLDRNLEGPDHKASIEPHQFKQMVDSIRNIEKALGTDKKVVSTSEKKNRDIARRSIVASRSIQKGEPFSEENIIPKRPGNGISPMLWDEIIGKIAPRSFEHDEQIEL